MKDWMNKNMLEQESPWRANLHTVGVRYLDYVKETRSADKPFCM